MAKRVLQLHQLNEEIVLGIQPRRVHRALEIKREPLLNTRHARTLCEIEEESRVEHDGRRENAIATQKIDLELHRVAEPAEDVDVVPALFVVAARWVVVDP